MKKVFLSVVAVCAVVFSVGCNREPKAETEVLPSENEVVQQSDGNIFLDIDDAYLLSDEMNPSRNTAEWRFKVKSTGRYEVWLTSLTRDTMDLHYDIPVIVTFEDKRISEKPVGNEIILDDRDVQKPYYRADSRIGSIYIEDPGQYNIQIISDKLRAGTTAAQSTIQGSQTILKSLILKPLTQ